MCRDCGTRKPERGKICFRCEKRRYRKKHPAKAAYQNLKSNAKRRGKIFNLSFEQFVEFAIETDYLNGRGRTATGFHIDRIDPEKGYTKDNIQVLTNTQNVKKYIAWIGRGQDNTSEFITRIQQVRQSGEDPECPY